MKGFLLVVMLLNSMFCGLGNEKNKEKDYEAVELFFPFNDKIIHGRLTLPLEKSGPFSVLVFVHGDGPLKADAEGYYEPIINRLARDGVASFSWDKQGVNLSTGDWKKQSMEERAKQVIAAMEMLGSRPELDGELMGLIGFSQAGWVLPVVAKESRLPKFMIMIGGAVSWVDQGAYFQRKRMTRDGRTEAEIRKALEYYHREVDFLAGSPTYGEYLEYQRENRHEIPGENEEPLDESYFNFIILNVKSDVRDYLKYVKIPVLALFGEMDQNVDQRESVRVYREEFDKAGHRDYRIQVIPEANHGLLPHALFPAQVPGLKDLILMDILGEESFMPGVLELMSQWSLFYGRRYL